MRVARFARSTALGGGTEGAIASSVSGSGSEEWQSKTVAFATRGLFDFNALALPPFDPETARWIDFSDAFSSSNISLLLVSSAPSTSKKASTSSEIRAHREAVQPVIRASFLASFGRRPSDRHIVISSRR